MQQRPSSCQGTLACIIHLTVAIEGTKELTITGYATKCNTVAIANSTKILGNGGETCSRIEDE